MALRVLVIDDRDLIAECLAARLSQEDDISDAATCAAGCDAVMRARALGADVALIRYGLNGPLGCIEVALEFSRALPECEVIVLSEFLDGDAILRCLRAGARNYVLASGPFSALLDALRAAPSGQTPLDPLVAQHMVSEMAQQSHEGSLSPGELEVLALTAEGLSNQEISKRLHLSLSTTKRCLSAIYEKLGVESRHEAVDKARRRGLLAGSA